MSEERLQEIKDSIEFQYTLAKAKGYDNALLFTNEEEELVEEIERLNEKIDKALEKINDYKIYCKKNKGFTEYTDIEIEAIEPVISKLEDILKEEMK